MYPSTEDLLKIRDGEPVDAAVRAAVDADPKLRAEVARLKATRNALQALPEIEPPPGVWDSVLAQAESERAETSLTPRMHWPLRGAIAATVAIFAVMFVVRAPNEPATPAPSTIVPEVPAVATSGLTQRIATPTYTLLAAESAKLERALNQISYQPRLMKATTASTITGLEDQIALIDQRLMYAPAYGLQPRGAEALMRERVDVMNALVLVRYAQAQRFGF